jgi:hypothetical protein
VRSSSSGATSGRDPTATLSSMGAAYTSGGLASP